MPPTGQHGWELQTFVSKTFAGISQLHFPLEMRTNGVEGADVTVVSHRQTHAPPRFNGFDSPAVVNILHTMAFNLPFPGFVNDVFKSVKRSCT